MDYSLCPACGRQISVTVRGRLRKHNDAAAYGHVCTDSGLLVQPSDPMARDARNAGSIDPAGIRRLPT
jgi:hypothetical protein